MGRLIHTHPAPLILVYDWQGGEQARRLGAKLATSREGMGKLIDSGERICCYDAEAGEGKQGVQGDGFEWFCEMSFEIGGDIPGRKLVCADELQDLGVDAYNIPDSLNALLTRGRRREIDTAFAASAANGIHGDGRNQVSEFYCFRCVDENALKYPKSLKMDVDRIMKLEDCQFIFRDNRTGEIAELDLWRKKANA